MSDKSIDVVIYGATGFTGKLVVEYMQESTAKMRASLGR